MMLTEFRIYELTRTSGRLFGSFVAGDAIYPVKRNMSQQLMIRDENGPSWAEMRLELHRPPDYEELLVMATGWSPTLVNLLTSAGENLSRTFLPMSIFTLYPTDIETGFARFTTAGKPGSLVTYMVTARRAQ